MKKQISVLCTYTLEVEDDGSVSRVVLNQQTSDRGDIFEVTTNQYRSAGDVPTEEEWLIIVSQNWPTPELQS